MNLSRVRLVLIIILCALLSPCRETIHAATPRHEIIGTDIASGTDNKCVLRDKYGFLWVGTGTGLYCYDGNGLLIHHPNSYPLQEISNLHVTALYEKGENLLIGGNGGLYIFDRQANVVTRFPYKTKYHVSISAMPEKIIDVGPDMTWISTKGQGFFIFDNVNKNLVQNSQYGSFYSDIAIGANGLVYLASLNGNIQVFRPDGEFVNELHIPGYSTDKNTISIEASGQNIWISAGSNLFCLDTKTDRIEKKLSNDTKSIITTLLARPNGTLLLGTNTGLWEYNAVTGSDLEYISVNNKTINDIRIEGLTTDINDNIIIVHPTGPLEFMTHESSAFRFIPLPASPDGVGLPLIRAIAGPHNNSGLWLGSDNGLFYHDFNTGTTSKIIPPGFINCSSITSLLITDERLWIGTKSDGIVIYDMKNNGWKQVVYNENIPYTIVSNEINDIYRSSRGDIYILTNWGICRYDSVADNFPQLTEFGQQIRGTVMQEDAQGGLWIATADNGLFYKGPHDRRFSNDKCGSTGRAIPVRVMHMDKKGNLWVATQNKGIFCYDYESGLFHQFNNAVFYNKSTLFFCDDKSASGSLWIGVTDMLLKLDCDGQMTIYDFIHNDKWFPVNGVVEPLDDGRSAIGCRNGLLIFDPGKMKSAIDETHIYPLSISFPSLENDSDELNRLGLNVLLYTRDAIELPYENNTFTVNLASRRPMTLPDIKYDYMLEGIDKSWISGVSTSELTYNNLPPGKYRLLLRPFGIKDSDISSLAIVVKSPWYRTGWAYLIYFVTAALLGWYAFVIIRKFLGRKYNRKLQALQIQKEREIFEAKTRYFVDLVHEIRTPLMLISLPLEQLTEDIRHDTIAVGKSSNMDYIKSMQRNIDYLLGITNQLLDFRKAENNSEIQLKLTRCNLSVMMREICRRFEEPMSLSGKHLTLILPADDISVTIDADKTERLIMNLIGNAMKYARREIVISLANVSESTVSLSVADDGPGVPEEERDRIFDTYYQIGNDNVAATLGTGLGLAYAKLIAEAHRGGITVSESDLGGAIFVIEIPRGNDLPMTECTECEGPDEYTADKSGHEESTGEKGITVLLAEDNQDLRKMIGDALARKYKVITAADGEVALELLADNDVDIIVSDVMMPRMDGLELCRRVKVDVRYSHIPFIILTAKTGADAHEEGMVCGADVYLEKPFPIKQLTYQIANMLRTRQLFYESMRKNQTTEMAGSTATEPDNGLNRVDAEFIERMNRIINESISNEEFSIDVLAENLNMSRSSFYRKITGVIGMTPSDYLRNFRLNRAAELIKEGCRITEVSDRVGFTSSSYFAKCFREKFGVLPSEYVSALASAGRTENRQ